MKAISSGPEGLFATLASPDGADKVENALKEISALSEDDGANTADQLVGWLLGGGSDPATRSAHTAGFTHRATQLPPAQQHRLVSALAAWLAPQPPTRPAPPNAAALLAALSAAQGPGSGGTAAAAQLVLGALTNRAAAADKPGEQQAADWGTISGGAAAAAAPVPPWLQRQALLLAEATGRWDAAGEAAGAGGSGGADAGDEGADLAAGTVAEVSSPKRPRMTSPEAAIAAPPCAGDSGPADEPHAAGHAQPQQQQQSGPAPAQLLACMAAQLSALEESLGDDSSVDWAALEQPAAWAALMDSGGSAACGGGGSGEGEAAGVHGALAGLSVHAAQALCRRLVAAPEAQAVVAGPVLRWAVAPKMAQLETTAPQALLECLQLAARRQPELLLDAVVRPLLAAPDLRAAQAQALAKLAKQEEAFRGRLLQALLDAQQRPNSSAPAWREPHLAVLQALLDARAECILPQLPHLVAALEAACDPPASGNGSGASLARSPKLAQAMMALAAGFGPGLSGDLVRRLAAAAAKTQSFLTKGLLAKLKALEGDGGGGMDLGP